MEAIRKVGFVGLGTMGYPMAGHLSAAGFDLVLADTAPGVADRFAAEHGGTVAPSLAALGESIQAVVTMLPTGAIVRQAVEEMLEALPEGALVIDMSSSSPIDTVETGALLTARGVGMVDAPVAGGVVFARDGTLAITCGGDAALVERCRPLFDAMAREVFHCGSLGAGHAMKALNNFVNASALITAFEALAIGRRFGLDTEVMLHSMTAAATGRNHPIEKKVAPYLADAGHKTGMALALLAKDVGIAADTACAVDAYAPIAMLCRTLWNEAAERFGGDKDQVEVARLWLEDRERST